MSLDRSLKSSGSMAQHRNVLTRAERIEKLKERGIFDPATGRALGLVKIANRKIATGKKVEKKAADGTVAPAAGAAAPAAGAKAAAPASKAPAAKGGAKK